MQLHKAEVHFPRPRLQDVPGALARQLTKDLFGGRKSIAVAVGSRGIRNLAAIVRQTVASLRELGVAPFVIPAMGSHGGATAEGQAAVLASYGITETEIGCPIRSSMEVVALPSDELVYPLYMDQHAFNADGVLLINRIKPHTDFRGRYESGLVKMSVIGLGKERQAVAMHDFGVRGLRDLVPKAAAHLLSLGKIVAGIGIVENAYDETAAIEVIPATQILDCEPVLLGEARNNMPRLPCDALDLLVIDEIGKDISGCGMDTNIIGRIRIAGELEPLSPKIRSIVVDDLTTASHGNATGLGLADVITRKMYKKIDFRATYRNIVTSSFLERGKTPLVAETARDACEIALRAGGQLSSGSERIIRIRNTLHLSELYISEAIARDLKNGPEAKNVRAEAHLKDVFTADGELSPF